jgi:hypothetical protein
MLFILGIYLTDISRSRVEICSKQAVWYGNNMSLTDLISFIALSCRALTFSTKNGIIPTVETYMCVHTTEGGVRHWVAKCSKYISFSIIHATVTKPA